MCLTETWLKPSEHNFMQSCIDAHLISKDNSFIVFNKSGMSDEDEHSPGRPYGGVAIVCRIINGLSYELIKCENNRIIAVLIKDSHDNPVQLVVCVYMPYYDKSDHKLSHEYVECIDAIQTIIDEYADRVAIKIVGDFNAQLPRSNVLVYNWHRSKGFTPYSRLLNDLIYGNNFKVIDHEFKQDVKYTYFNIPRQIYTWIDHMISTEYDISSVKSCKIVPLDDGNVSDHLPIRMCMNLNIKHQFKDSSSVIDSVAVEV